MKAPMKILRTASFSNPPLKKEVLLFKKKFPQDEESFRSLLFTLIQFRKETENRVWSARMNQFLEETSGKVKK